VKGIVLAASIAAVAALAVLLIYAAGRPDTFQVRRTASMRAPAAALHPLIHDLHEFNRWNPYGRKDPDLKGSYRGPPSGPGAAYEFAGNKDVGKGSIEILESSAPTRVTMKLDMVEPFEAHNIVEFTLAPRGEETEVTWAMRGASPYIARLIGVFIDMDRMIGRDFEAGLANLKGIAERP